MDNLTFQVGDIAPGAEIRVNSAVVDMAGGFTACFGICSVCGGTISLDTKSPEVVCPNCKTFGLRITERGALQVFIPEPAERR